MKKLIVVLGLTLLASPAMATESIDVISVNSESRWHFRKVSAHTTDKGTQVNGHITAINPINLPKGYINVMAYSASGELIDSTTVNYTPSLLTHYTKRKGGSRFTAEFDQILPVNASVTVAFQSI